MFSQATVNLLSILFFIGFVQCFTSDDLRINLTNGNKLVGRYLRSYSGRPIKAFKGIPYAKPPIDKLRFKAPEPMEKWDGVYEAINDGSICSQRNPFRRSFTHMGTEDCLYLNVFTPHRYVEKKSLLPVLIWFHGGGFMCASGSFFGPDNFLDHDVVLVTANYRLGPLGFLSTEDENCPGNFGLKDQVMVLKWVHENIIQFGGDPKSVTVFGSSAGGASVTYLMTSPLAGGLFHKAIAQSGTNLAPWSQPAHKGVASKRAAELAQKFDCFSPNDWTHTINCLRNVSAENITSAFYDFFGFDTDPMVPFPPVVEPNISEAFLTEHPREVISKNSLSMPLMTGITFDEGLLKSAAFFNLPGLFDELVKYLDKALPIALYYDHQDSFVQQSISNKIKEFYFDNHLTRDKDLNFTNLFGDGWFLTAMDAYLRLRMSYKGVAPTYVYLLTPKASISYTAQFRGDPDTYYGVSHADDLLYLFPVRDKFFATTLPTRDEVQVQKAMIRMWVDFASTGNPTPEQSSLPKWNEIKGFPVDYYRIGNLNFENKPMFGMESGGLFEDRAQFWRDLGAHLPTNVNDVKESPSRDELKKN